MSFRPTLEAENPLASSLVHDIRDFIMARLVELPSFGPDSRAYAAILERSWGMPYEASFSDHDRILRDMAEHWREHPDWRSLWPPVGPRVAPEWPAAGSLPIDHFRRWWFVLPHETQERIQGLLEEDRDAEVAEILIERGAPYGVVITEWTSDPSSRTVRIEGAIRETMGRRRS